MQAFERGNLIWYHVMCLSGGKHCKTQEPWTIMQNDLPKEKGREVLLPPFFSASEAARLRGCEAAASCKQGGGSQSSAIIGFPAPYEYIPPRWRKSSFSSLSTRTPLLWNQVAQKCSRLSRRSYGTHLVLMLSYIHNTISQEVGRWCSIPLFLVGNPFPEIQYCQFNVTLAILGWGVVTLLVCKSTFNKQ